MKIYYVGYYNEEWIKNDFVIMAETRSKYVAEEIVKHYNSEYKRNGMQMELIILEQCEIPKQYRYVADI